MRIAAIALSLVTLAPLGGDAVAQGRARGADAELPAAEQVERALRTAREGPLQVRSQAAGRLVALGDVAAAVLVERFGHDLDALAEQGQETVEVLARFDEPRLRELAWRALDDADFPWRPAAMRSVAREPRAGEFARFVAGLGDPLAAVRAAAIPALAVEDERRAAAIDALVPRLDDEDDRVRRAAAGALDSMGVARALSWPLEDLARDDTWFEMETGRAARHDAARLIAARLGSLEGYAPERSPGEPENRAALARLRARIEERAKDAPIRVLDDREPAAWARASGALSPALAGVEVRSCRRGETFLALGDDGTLRVGLGNPLVVDIGRERTASLVAALERAYESLDGRSDFGTPGCDLEVYRLAGETPSRPAIVRLMKGPAPTPDLRPDAFRPFIDALVAAIDGRDIQSDDPRAADLSARLTAALEAVGGPLDPRTDAR